MHTPVLLSSLVFPPKPEPDLAVMVAVLHSFAPHHEEEEAGKEEEKEEGKKKKDTKPRQTLN